MDPAPMIHSVLGVTFDQTLNLVTEALEVTEKNWSCTFLESQTQC